MAAMAMAASTGSTAAAGIFRRCGRSLPPSFRRESAPSSFCASRRGDALWLRTGGHAAVVRGPPRRAIACSHHRHRPEPSRARLFSTSNSSSTPPIEVTVTKTPVDDSRDEDVVDDNDRDPRLSIPSQPGQTSLARAKSPDQVAEEEILALQSEVQQHHRHAAYDAALGAAARLLERTSGHFGDLHPATASAHNNVGLMHKLLGNHDAAREAYHEALRTYGEVCGKDHASYAAALSNLGMLERGRVLEAEAAEGEEGDDGDDANGGGEGSNEEEVDLEELRDNNAHPRSAKKMSAVERMQLNESAIEYFDEAHRIRLVELGADHPHTIASRSQLGSAMAAAVVAERKGRIGGLVEEELRRLKRQNEVGDAKEMEAYVPEAVAKAAAKSERNSRLARRRWEAAEEHLRGALGTAVENPRGESVDPLMYITIGGAEVTEKGKEGAQEGLTLSPDDERSLSKKERRRLEKERMRERRRANRIALQSARGGGGKAAGSAGHKMAVQGAAGKVTTLSASTAAQNLAVFLKNYSDWLRLTLTDSSREAQPSPQKTEQQTEWNKLDRTVQEARHLYEAALHVRTSMLPAHHPEVVASKFSLAELLDAPGTTALDEQRANALREEILNAYNVEEREEAGDGGDSSGVDSK